jgi:hypothetical protein
MNYPRNAGYKKTTTSKDAAESVDTRVALLRTRCCHLLMFGEYTADELANLMGESILSVRPRMSELKRMGFIQDTGTRRLNASGKGAIVWGLR